MQLRGAELRNFFDIGKKCNSDDRSPFAGLRTVFEIPTYQRGFRWDSAKITQLFDDFRSHEEQTRVGSVSGADDDKYFAGGIVTVVRDGDEPHSVVDGQQRLTTLYLANYLYFLTMRCVMVHASEMQIPGALGWVADKGSKENLISCLGKLGLSPERAKSLTAYFAETQQFGLDENSRSAAVQKFREAALITEKGDNVPPNNRLVCILKDALSGERCLLNHRKPGVTDFLLAAMASVDVRLDGRNVVLLRQVEQMPSEWAPFIDAMDAMFNRVFATIDHKVTSAGTDWGTAFNRCQLMAEYLHRFLHTIRFAVIQARSPGDAFVLFEVLNDRAMALEQIDIVKNKLYGALYRSFMADPDGSSEYDISVADLEGTWLKCVAEVNQYRRTYVVMSSFLYFFASSVDLNLNVEFRSKVEAVDEPLKALTDATTAYLNTSPYDRSQAARHFRAIRDAGQLFEAASLQKKGKVGLACRRFAGSETVSWLNKAIWLCHALDYKAVMPAIVLPELYARDSERPREAASTQANPDIEHFGFYWTNLLLASPDAAVPRWAAKFLFRNFRTDSRHKIDFVRDCIRYVVTGKNEFVMRYADKKGEIPATESLSGRLKNWRYGQGDSANLKVKVLFHRLIADPIRGLYKTVATRDAEFALDHMEPQVIDEKNPKAYFPASEERDDLVNGLGNMMLLVREWNSSKSNNSMYQIFDYLEESKYSGLKNHFMVQDIRKLLDTHSREHTIEEGRKIKVPSVEFFSKRRERLTLLIETMLQAEFGDHKAMNEVIDRL